MINRLHVGLLLMFCLASVGALSAAESSENVDLANAPSWLMQSDDFLLGLLRRALAVKKDLAYQYIGHIKNSFVSSNRTFYFYNSKGRGKSTESAYGLTQSQVVELDKYLQDNFTQASPESKGALKLRQSLINQRLLKGTFASNVVNAFAAYPISSCFSQEKIQQWIDDIATDKLLRNRQKEVRAFKEFIKKEGHGVITLPIVTLFTDRIVNVFKGPHDEGIKGALLGFATSCVSVCVMKAISRAGLCEDALAQDKCSKKWHMLYSVIYATMRTAPLAAQVALS